MLTQRIRAWRSTETGRPIWPGPLIGAVIVGLLAGLLSVTPAGEALEQRFGLWALFRARGTIEAPGEVVIIGMRRDTGERIALPRERLGADPCADLQVDDDSATHRMLGDVPERWGRCHYVELLRQLQRAEPRIVVFDVTFRPRHDIPSGEDRALGIAMRRLGNVIIAQKLKVRPGADPREGDDGPVPLSADIADAALGRAPMPLPADGADRFDEAWTFKEHGWQAATLPAVALQAYFIDAYPALYHLAAQMAPAASLALPATTQALRQEGRLDLHTLHLRGVFRQMLAGPVDARLLLERTRGAPGGDPREARGLSALIQLYAGDARRVLRFYGPPRTIRTLDMTTVLAAARNSADADPFGLRGKAVFVGYSDEVEWELLEKFGTAMGTGRFRLSGVEVIATTFANLLDGTTLRPAGAGPRFWIAVATGVGVAVFSYASAGLLGTLIVLLGAMLYFGAALVLFSRLYLWLPVFIPLAIATPLALVYAYAHKLLDYRRDRAALHYILEQFVPHDVVDVLARNARHLGSLKETVNVACVMTDVQGYTALSSKLAPEQVAELLSQYFAAIFRPVAEHGGFISDLKGDSILAIWTDPRSERTVRERVCRAALALHAAVERFNQAHPASPLPTRIGLHYGPATLGPVGAPGHYEYRAVGDTVNTSSRVEQLSKDLGTHLLVTAAMADGLDSLLLRDLGSFQLRGRSGATRIFELRALSADASPDERALCRDFTTALAAYESGDLDAARDAFASILQQHPGDGPSAYYLRRLAARA